MIAKPGKWIDSARRQLQASSHSYRRRRLTLEGLETRALLSATTGTDKLDYAGGETALISGSGFAVGESVTLQVIHAQATPGTGAGHEAWQVIDGGPGDFDGVADGNISTSWYINPDDSADATFLLTAQGSWGSTAQTFFTDSQLSGAIFTTNSLGQTVNQNLFALRTDVYLNGGPQNVNSAGLPDGTYYFQVTTPSWHASQANLLDGLLSTDDAIERQLVVSGGHVAGVGTVGSHSEGTLNPANGSTAVQLAPFDVSTNSGGVYKVWLIARTDTTTVDSLDSRIIHFQESDSKTDNFKVLQDIPGPDQGSIAGLKFEDHNGDRMQDAGDQGLVGWTIELDNDNDPDNGVLLTTATSADGTFEFKGLIPATYYVREQGQNGWTQTRGNDGYLVTVLAGATADGNLFGNFKNIAISGQTFYDFDTDGVQSGADEPGINDWMIHLYKDADGNGTFEAAIDTFLTSTTTATVGSANGHYSFANLGPGTYFVTEGVASLPGTWVQTAPLPERIHTVLSSSGVDAVMQDFGNVRLGRGGGLTLGFWSNKNGQSLITDSDLAFLCGLNLRNGDGSNFDPTSKTQVRSWLLNGSATNAAYMLSVQMTAMVLNVRHGFVQADALIYAPETTSANLAGFASVQAILDEANTELGWHGDTRTDGLHAASRPYQGILKDILDKANNNQNFVQAFP